ncbi:MAG TPA: peptide chain release factor N(5)-glutamine methyltransferase [Acidimicrobiales bacterium]|nr:peptide chain release factor N(5)-glutamine methyltransferase [Acidimicrobiales bacterium]
MITVPAPPPTRSAVQADLATRLGSPNEARWMVEQVLGSGPPSAGLEAAGLAELDRLANRRLAGEPLQYVLGTWAFRSLDLDVDLRALIPRPETEQVVEVALRELRRLPCTGPGRAAPVVVDLGTGSGAVALSVATETDALVWAVDVDPDALALAAANRDRIAREQPDLIDRVVLASGSWFGALVPELRGRVDLVVSNPPYVAEAEWPELDPEVRREPRVALVAAAGTDGTPGLADVEAVLRGAAGWLARPGAVVVELAPHQAPAAVTLARTLGFTEVRVERDLAGRDRAVVGRVS